MSINRKNYFLLYKFPFGYCSIITYFEFSKVLACLKTKKLFAMYKIIEALICLAVFGNVFALNEDKSILVDAITSIISEGALGFGLNYILIDSKLNVLNMDLINEMVSRTSRNAILQLEDFDNLSKIKRSSNVIILDNFSSFEKFYAEIIQEKFDFQGKFLIVLTECNDSYLMELKQIFSLLWKKFIVNVIILIKPANDTTASLYTFFPYTKYYCAEVHPTLWNIFENGHFRQRHSFYPEKINNLYGCPLNIASFNAPTMTIKRLPSGEYSFKEIDGNLLEVLAKEMSFKINVTYMAAGSWGVLYSNGSSSGAMKHVSDHQED